MKLSLSAAGLLASALGGRAAKLAPVVRSGTTLLVDGKPWKAVGPNVYWLGLDENVVPPVGEPYYAPTKASYPTKERITEVMATVLALGGTTIRSHTLGVSTGNPLSVWPEKGVVNEKAFDAIDWAVYQAGRYGVRLMVPLVDNYDYYHGGKYNFLRWAGFDLTGTRDDKNPLIQQFYTNATIVATFKDYIKTLLTHRNQYNNLKYAEDPTIFAYETGNELLGPVWGDMNSPADWVRDIAQYVKSLAPNKLVVDGTYGINKTHLDIEEVDIFSNHMYPVDTAKLQNDLRTVGAVGKPFFSGEYDWVGGNTANLQSFFKILEESPVAVGDTFWSMFGHNAPDCKTFVNHGDGLTFQYGNPRNTANQNSRIQLVRKHLVAMSQGRQIAPDEPLPAVPCPAPESPPLSVSH
ncbi:glycoside hydrolase family 5 protein [Durotheca rogersii]|uniref:glycoside hydrolase family 5 protein n=1 Tax=Durotheca rogersii TaxID=419775 RepID=UPI00221E634E|nr:glycoside hydrolase family 5 protein [Durotheca rogersii]KAI5862155.1 glycoside hydrolase family 5 protein [Durotheca rogersii]